MQRGPEELGSRSKKCKLDNDQVENENFIDYICEPPSLQSIAVVSIAVKLWTEPDTLEELELYCLDTHYYKSVKLDYKRLKEKVLNKLSLMGLPKSLELSVIHAMRPIVLQLLRCFDYRDFDYRPFYQLLKVRGTVYWTVEGTIDRARTLKELIKSGSKLKDIKHLFYLSCQYCLEECVTELWNRLSPTERNELSVDQDLKIKYHIVIYWTSVLRNEMHLLFRKIPFTRFVSAYKDEYSVYQNMVSLSVYVGNSFAVKYFWRKLTIHEKDSHIKEWLFQIVKYPEHAALSRSGDPRKLQFQECCESTEIMCFFLSNLGDSIQQKEFFQEYPCFVLRSLFYFWPYERFFVPTILVMFDFLDKRDFVFIMNEIFKEIGKGRRTHEFFKEICLLSPGKFRHYCIDAIEISRFQFIWKFINIGDVDTLFAIFDHLALKYVLFSDVMKNRKAMLDIIYSNKLDLLDRGALKVMSSDSYYNSLKDCLMSEQADSLFYDLTCNGAFQEAKQFLEWGFGNPEKVKDFKKNKIDPKALFHGLMHGDCENLNQFMMWYYETKKVVCQFKKSFMLKTTESNEWGIVLSNFSRRFHNNSWQRFEDFINWCIKGVYTSRKISHLKKQLLKSVVSVLRVGNFDFATKFVNWCLDSTGEVNRFKNELIISEDVIDLLISEVSTKYPKWNNVIEIIRWFSPFSKEAVASFEEILNEKKNNRENVLKPICNLLEHFNQISNNKHDVSNLKITFNVTMDDGADSRDYDEFLHNTLHFI